MTEDQALNGIATYMAKIKQSHDYISCEKVISTLYLDILPSIVLVMWLRSTFSCRAYLPSWDAMYDKVAAILTKRGENAKVKLRGLKQEQVKVRVYDIEAI